MKNYKLIPLFLFIIFINTLAFAQDEKWQEMYSKAAQALGTMNYPEGIKICKEALNIAEKTYGQEHINTLLTLNLLASCYQYSNQPKESEKIHEKIIEINKKLYGNDSRETLDAYRQLAALYQSSRNYDKAEKIYNDVMKAIKDTTDINYYTTLINLGSLYQLQGKYSKAEEVYRQSLKFNEKQYGKSSSNYSSAMMMLAGLFQMQSKNSEVVKIYKEILEIYESNSQTDDAMYSSALGTLANLYQSLGKYAESEEIYSKIENSTVQKITETEAKEGKESQSLVSLLNQLSNIYLTQGRYSEYELISNKIINLYEKIYSGNETMMLGPLAGLAAVYYMQGKYSKAENIYRQILKINEKLYGKDNQNNLSSLMMMASLLNMQNRIKETEDMYKVILRIAEKPGINSITYNSVFYLLGIFYQQQKRFDEAEKYYKQSISLDIKNTGKEDQMSIAPFLGLGYIYLEKNMIKEALNSFNKVLEISERLYGKSSLFSAGYLYSISVFLYQKDLVNDAGKYEKIALDIFETNIKSDPNSLGYAYFYTLANILYNQKEYKKAENIFDKLLTYIKRQYDQTFPFLSEKEKFIFLDKNSYSFPCFYSFALNYLSEKPSISGSVYNLLLWQKGIVLSSKINMINNILKSGDKSSIKTLNQLKSYREKLAKFYSGTEAEQKKNQKEIEALELRVNELESELAKSTAYSENKKLKNITWKDIAGKLKDDECALEFISFKYNFKKFTDTTFYAALIINKNTKEYPAMVVLGSEKEIQDVVNLYKMSISKDPMKKTLEKGNKQYSFIWKPLEKYLSGIKRIYLSPDGVLNQISFGVLVDDENKFLNEKYELRYVSNTKDLFREYDIKNLNKYSILIGNPKFSADSRALDKNRSVFQSQGKDKENQRGLELLDLRSNPLNDLPGTKIEIEEISNTLSANNWDVKSYTGEAALEEVVKNVKSPRILHLATHGFFLPENDIDYNQIQLRDQTNDERGYIPPMNPMFKSGLFFAGANDFDKPSDFDDGILTSYESSDLNLQGTEIVVLSACETGLGSVKSGEGVFGLRRAFQFAGAEAIIMSLWSVPDNETQEMMTLFYKKWIGGLDKYIAFRDAQNELRKIIFNRFNKDIPYYWGAFIMVGK